MKVTQIDIIDIGNIAQMTMRPGALNIISGNNGEGKTTILKAISAVFEGGHRPGLRRRLATGGYAKKGEIKITLDTGAIITRTITEKRSALDVVTADGLPVPEGPQHFVERLASGFAFDPIAFCTARPKDRLAYLQNALGITFEPAEVAEACGMKPPQPVDLDGLELIRAQIFQDRARENVLVKQATGTVERLSGALGEDDATGRGKDWPAEAQRTQGLRDEYAKKQSDEVAAVNREANGARQQVNDEINAKIAELEGERRRQLAAIEQAEKESHAEIHERYRAGFDELSKQLATIQERVRKSGQDKAFRDEIEAARAAAETSKNKSAKYTESLTAIDRLKKQKMETLPISGVEIRDGQFFCDGLPFDDLNTGAQYLKAFQVGALQPGELGLMVADRLETLGDENWRAFQDAALGSGFQIFATRVTDGPLNVESIESATTA